MREARECAGAGAALAAVKGEWGLPVDVADRVSSEGVGHVQAATTHRSRGRLQQRPISGRVRALPCLPYMLPMVQWSANQDFLILLGTPYNMDKGLVNLREKSTRLELHFDGDSCIYIIY